MGSSTFSGPILAGGSKDLKGTAILCLTLPASKAGLIGSLPAGCTVLEAVSDTAGIEATISNGAGVGNDFVVSATVAGTIQLAEPTYYDRAPTVTVDVAQAGRLRISYTMQYFKGYGA